MTDNIETARPKISATFSRAVSDGNYGTIKAEAWVQGDVAPDATPAQITEQATMLLQTAAVAVWDQRKTATGRQPHFKEAVPRGGTGKGKDGQAKGYWPPS